MSRITTLSPRKKKCPRIQGLCETPILARTVWREPHSEKWPRHYSIHFTSHMFTFVFDASVFLFSKQIWKVLTDSDWNIQWTWPYTWTDADRLNHIMYFSRKKIKLPKENLHTSPVVSMLYLFEASMSFSSRESSFLYLESCTKIITNWKIAYQPS